MKDHRILVIRSLAKHKLPVALDNPPAKLGNAGRRCLPNRLPVIIENELGEQVWIGYRDSLGLIVEEILKEQAHLQGTVNIVAQPSALNPDDIEIVKKRNGL